MRRLVSVLLPGAVLILAVAGFVGPRADPRSSSQDDPGTSSHADQESISHADPRSSSQSGPVGVPQAVDTGAGVGAVLSPETEALLDMHLDWRGGRQAFESLNFLERRGDIRIGGDEGIFRAVGWRDGWLRYDVKLDGVQQVEAVTPHGGWRWVNGGLSDLDADRIEAFRTSIDEMFARHLLLSGGYAAEYIGREAKAADNFEVLRLSNEINSIDLFLDESDGSLHWTREPQEDGSQAWTRLSDWRLVDGIRYAFRSDRWPDEPERRQLTQWREIVPSAGDDGAEASRGEFLRPPQQSGALEFDEGVDWTPFNLFLDGYIELDGQVGGRGVRAMLDSGAGITVLDKKFADSIGLSIRDAGTIQGIGGAEQLFLADGVDVAVPGVTLRDATVAVLDLSEIADKMGRSFEVILGVEVFTRALVTIDYPGRRVRFSPPRPYDPPAGARSVRMYSRRGVPKVECRYEHLPKTLCDIDTGSNSTVDIVAHYVDKYGMLDDRAAVSMIATGGVGGMLETPISTLQEFEFAGVSVGSSPANFMADAVGSLDTDEIAGNIGAAVLRAFVLVFDYPGMRFHVVNPGDAAPIRRDRSGLQTTFRGDHLEVFYVSPGSPAEVAGLQKGQRLTVIGGDPVGSDYLAGGFHWRFGPPGTAVVMTDDRGRDYTIVLADYF